MCFGEQIITFKCSFRRASADFPLKTLSHLGQVGLWVGMWDLSPFLHEKFLSQRSHLWIAHDWTSFWRALANFPINPLSHLEQVGLCVVMWWALSAFRDEKVFSQRLHLWMTHDLTWLSKCFLPLTESIKLLPQVSQKSLWWVCKWYRKLWLVLKNLWQTWHFFPWRRDIVDKQSEDMQFPRPFQFSIWKLQDVKVRYYFKRFHASTILEIAKVNSNVEQTPLLEIYWTSCAYKC